MELKKLPLYPSRIHEENPTLLNPSNALLASELVVSCERKAESKISIMSIVAAPLRARRGHPRTIVYNIP